MATSTHNARIELAMADLANQDKPNYMGTAKKYGVARMTLRDRFLGQTLSMQAAASKYHQKLTLVQEETLIKHINSLTDRSLPPTSRMVRNLAEEIISGPIGKNWTGIFVKRYKDRLTSLNLRTMDN